MRGTSEYKLKYSSLKEQTVVWELTNYGEFYDILDYIFEDRPASCTFKNGGSEVRQEKM